MVGRWYRKDLAPNQMNEQTQPPTPKNDIKFIHPSDLSISAIGSLCGAVIDATNIISWVLDLQIHWWPILHASSFIL